MDIIISCRDGNVLCDQDVILKQSKIISEHFSEVEVCSCNRIIIIPDLKCDLVRLAVTLLDRGKSDVIELPKDLLETVAPVYSLLQIQCVSSCEERFLNPDTGYLQEVESYSSPLWTCPSCDQSFNSRKARKQHQKRSRLCQEYRQDRQLHHLSNTRRDEVEKDTVTENVMKCNIISKLRVKDEQVPQDEATSYSTPNSPGSENDMGFLVNSFQLQDIPVGQHKLTSGDLVCHECKKSYTSRRNLYFHFRKEHKEPTECLICNAKFSSKVKYNDHVKKIHEPEQTPKYLCSKCGKSFKRCDKYKQHDKCCGIPPQKNTTMKLHTMYKCTKCAKIYQYKRSLDTHTKFHHHIVVSLGSSYFKKISTKTKLMKMSSVQRNSCNICRTLFSSRCSLNAHNKRFHAKTQGNTINIKGSYMVLDSRTEIECYPQKCAFCERRFKYKQDIDTHLRIDHYGEAVYQCNDCRGMFKSKKSLWEHRSRDHRNQIWRCTACGKTLKRKENLKNHMKTHTTVLKTKKPLDQVSRAEQLRRMHGVLMQFNQSISGLSETDKVKMFQSIVRNNPDVLETYRQYPLNEDDVTDMVKDANLSDRQLLKILTIIRRKWGRSKVTTNIKTLLRDRKQLLSHLFTVELLDKEDQVHFRSKTNVPLTRYLSIPNIFEKL